MNIWMNLILALQLLAAAVVIGLVLIQHGKGADMGASFGSGSSGSLFGATGSANFLSRSTAVAATVFFVATLVLAYWGTAGATRGSGTTGTSVLERTVTAPAPGVAPSAPLTAASAAMTAASAALGAASTATVAVPAPATAGTPASGATPAIPK